ncbi:MAG: ATP-dependent helicase/nuclease subunit A [Alphaproteobacteria bacterium]|jgi:ATP-dependent helicase/nuclease subunit A
MDIQTLKQDHLKRQNSASDPKHSVWVSANAGAGKTHILVERIIRLLLPPYECAPHKILCMTYTKAAATEMTERLFQRLGSWVSKSDADLSSEMTQMMGYAPSATDMITARRLFAKALETSGGLKIQTIHGFCEHILRRFPLEAGFSKDFTLLSDIELRKFYMDGLEHLSLYALQNPTSPLNEAFSALALHYSFQSLVDLLINSRKIYAIMKHQNKPFWDSKRLAHYLNLPIPCDLELLYGGFFNLIDDLKISALISALEDGSKTDKVRADALRYMQIKDFNNFDLWQDFFMNAKKDAMLSRSRFITKKIQDHYPDHADYVYALYDKFSEVLTHHNGLAIYNMTHNISLILIEVHQYVDKLKQEQSACDFDDIIIRCRDLITNPEVSEWILWKFDGGIDHIFVDEAQDTSPEQWDIVRALSQAFFKADKPQKNHCTIFAVGDEKQSIYGFQGAAPEKMSQNAQFFADAAHQSQAQWQMESLRGSFRSSPAIMQLVDSVFQNEAASGVLFGDNDKVEHYAVANKGPGYVQIMPPVIPPDHDTQNAWESPLDAPSETTAAAINAQNIALKIQELLQSPQLLPSTGRPAEPKDIMILLQSRDATMRHLMRSFKRLDIPVSGLDRINLLTEVAILDLLAVIDFVLYPDDDLTLAQILRSPLCHISEDDLFYLAHNREGKLWQSLGVHHGESAHFTTAYEFLKGVIKCAEHASPYDFLNYILENTQGRKKFIARLGADCIDALDEILNKALDFVNNHTPSLQKFVHLIRNSDGSEKREMDSNSNQIQMMTIHGSKGLESPIIFLPNCCDMPRTNADLYKRFVITPDFIPMVLKEGGAHQAAQDQKEFLKKKDEDENRRLLYVALTRAKDWLFISGKLRKTRASENRTYKIPENSWYDYIVKGLLSLDNAQIIEHEDTPFSTYIYQDTQTANNVVSFKPKPISPQIDTENEPETKPETDLVSLPDWINKLPFNHVHNPEKIFVSPSIAMAQAMTDTTNNERNNASGAGQTDYNPLAKQRGIIIHRLLELLTQINPEQHQQAADNFFKNQQLSPQDKAAYRQEVFNIIHHPDYSQLLSLDGLSEIPIVGHLKNMDNLAISGKIDRMVITPTQVLIADYKTDRNLSTIGDVSPPYILQMALYKEALKQIYPDKSIECFIIATAKPKIITIDNALLQESLRQYQAKRKVA